MEPGNQKNDQTEAKESNSIKKKTLGGKAQMAGKWCLHIAVCKTKKGSAKW